MISDTCDCCGEYVKSPYSFRHEGVRYSGHKRCMGVPMVHKLTKVVAPKSPPNIALTGALRSGKDTVAAYLTQKYGYTRFAFGDGIREVTRRLYPDMYANGEKPRALLQWFGQMARSFDEDVWVRDMFRRIEVARTDCDNDSGNYTYPFRAVITDLRQPNEYARCRAEGFVIIRIKAKSALRIQRAVESADTFRYEDLVHLTESYVDSFAVDYEITNDESLAELYAQIDVVMSAIPPQ